MKKSEGMVSCNVTEANVKEMLSMQKGENG